MREYLEPVLKKCGLEKKPVSKLQKVDRKGSVSDGEGSRTRSSSVTESVQDVNESEPESTQLNTSSATTPVTMTSKGDSLPNSGGGFTHIYPFSRFNIPSTTASDGNHFSSPIFPTPGTPDSGISVRTHLTCPSPSEMKRKFSTSNAILPPPLPPEENAPPLPPQDIEAPPPLPPLPPASGGDLPPSGIENISSDEEDTRNQVMSPVSLSPPHPSSPHSTAGKTSHIFEPSLGLQTLLNRTSTTEGVGGTKPCLALSSPRPAYEPEVEEISGDESPVMVYFEPLKVESISDDDEMGGDDMEISDNENEQDNVIELNVNTVRVFPPAGPMMGPHLLHHMPHPHFHAGPPHPNFFPLHHGPLPPPPLPGTFPLHPPLPHFHPHHHLMFPGHSPPPPHGRRRGDGPRRHYNSSSTPFIKDHQVSRPPNGYIGSVSRFPPSRSFSKSKVLRNFSSPKNKTESISQDVLFKAMEQLRLILLNDVHKKIVESSAYPVLDAHWEKREKEVSYKSLICCDAMKHLCPTSLTFPLDILLRNLFRSLTLANLLREQTRRNLPHFHMNLIVV